MKKIIKKFLTCMLCCVIVAGLTPCVAQAADINLVSQGVDFYYGSNLHSSYKSVPFTVKLNDTYGGNLAGAFVLDFKRTINWTEGTDWTLKAKLDPAAFQNIKAYVSFNVGQNYWIRQCTYENGVITCHEDSWVNNSNNVHVELHIIGFTYRPSYKDKKIVLDFEAIQVQSKTEEQGFWNKVVQWLKDIRDKLVNGFNDMVNAIELQFHQLVEKLQKLFDDVTEWLFNIADSIQDFIHKVGNWFSELFNNISGKIDLVITDIKQWVHDLFVPDPQYMEQYRTQWDQWMQVHLGFLYQSMAIIESLMSAINNGQTNSTLIVTIPKLQLPDNFGGHVIFDGGIFNLGNELLEKHSKIKWLYTTSQAFITGLAVFWTVYFGYKKIHLLIAERSD